MGSTPSSVRLTGTAVGIAVVTTLAVATSVGLGSYFFSRHHMETTLEGAEAVGLAQGEVIREALRHQMLVKNRGLIEEMVKGFAEREGIRSLEVLDHRGYVWYSNDDASRGTILSKDAPACVTCHQDPPSERTNSQVFETSDQSILRVVVPLENSGECHECHDPVERINGIVILDTDVTEMRHAMSRDMLWLVAGSAGLTFLLVAMVAGIVQLFFLRRLRRLETAAHLIAGGDLDRRVPVEGTDTISWLGREFNAMADSVTGLVRQVRDQRQRLETVINSIDDGIVVLDPARRIVAANTAFLDRTGLAREEVLGCACRKLDGGICSTEDCPTLACLGTGIHQVRLCERQMPDDSTIWEEIHSSPVFGPGGEILQVVEVWRDISDRRGAEARMAESHRLASLGMLASGFSHEMNTPLATILACVEGILGEVRSTDRSANDLTRIDETASIAREQILRCKGITQHFLRLSRGQISPGDMVDVRLMVEAVIRLVAPTAKANGVKIELRPEPERIMVRADEADLQHALMNLLINAVDACDSDGEVSVLVKVDSTVSIRIRDNGKGISSGDLKRIFEPFTSLREGGTGLGLFLALNFVRRWGGDIVVESTPGMGSQFTIELPTDNDGPAGAASKSPGGELLGSTTGTTPFLGITPAEDRN